MIDRNKVVSALEQKRPHFAAHLVDEHNFRRQVEQRLHRFSHMNCAQIEAVLDRRRIDFPGARPSSEYDRAGGLCLPFAERWQSSEEARKWARDCLHGRPVIAVDGSQITPDKEYSAAVGAVQVGWYINQHSQGGHFVKDLEFEAVFGDEVDTDESDAEGGFPVWYVNQKRFVRECERLSELLSESAASGVGDRSLALFDGSFIISFAGQMQSHRAVPYVTAVSDLLEKSAAVRVPLVGFVDTSYSHDLARLVDICNGHDHPRKVSDAAILASALPSWGDRTPAFYCAREDRLSSEGRAQHYADVAFVYVRFSQNGVPVRVEMPRWIVEEDRVDDVIDLVRAECVVGAGYPYALETADALTVLSKADRDRFYAWFEQFASNQGVTLLRTGKAQSKLVRRM
jgi:hypothetical protein